MTALYTGMRYGFFSLPRDQNFNKLQLETVMRTVEARMAASTVVFDLFEDFVTVFSHEDEESQSSLSPTQNQSSGFGFSSGGYTINNVGTFSPTGRVSSLFGSVLGPPAKSDDPELAIDPDPDGGTGEE